jgi:microcystin-dependent protein
MADQFLGEIRLVAFSFVPRTWTFCNGQVLSINQFKTLYGLIQTTYGGDGRSNFKVPDLTGRAAVGFGNAPGLSPRTLGQNGGVPTVTLRQEELAQHTHALMGDPNTGDSKTPVGCVFAEPPGTARGKSKIYAANQKTDPVLTDPSFLSTVGGIQPHDNLQPFLTLNYMIALEGTYPAPPAE